MADQKIITSSRQGSQPLFLRSASARLINLRTREMLTVNDLRLKFQCERSIGSNPNQGTLEIYNLSERSRNFANVPPEKPGVETAKGLYVELSAGYQNFTRMILAGNATGGSAYEAPEWVTRINLVDGGTALRSSTIQKSYGAGFSMNRVIMDVVESFHLPIGYVKPIITADVVRNGLTLDGNNKKVLDDFAATYGFRWSVQNGAINLVDKNSGLPQPAVNLSPQTGLLGSPVRTDKGINFKCLLIPLIVPGGKVVLSNNSVYNGGLIVQKASYAGDTHGSEWTIDVEAITG